MVDKPGRRERYRVVISHKCANDDKTLYVGHWGMWPFTGPWWSDDISDAFLFAPRGRVYPVPLLEKALKVAKRDRGCVKVQPVMVATEVTLADVEYPS